MDYIPSYIALLDSPSDGTLAPKGALVVLHI